MRESAASMCAGIGAFFVRSSNSHCIHVLHVISLLPGAFLDFLLQLLDVGLRWGRTCFGGVAVEDCRYASSITRRVPTSSAHGHFTCF